MSIRRLAAVSAIAVMTFAACSGGGSSAAPSDGRRARPRAPPPSAAESAAASEGAAACKVGVSWNNFKEERWAKWDEPAIKEVVEAAGGSYVGTDAGSSAEKQATDVEQLITDGANVIIILAQDGTAIQPTVQAAVDQGIPVIAYDRLIENDKAFYITFDNPLVGQLMAEEIIKVVPEGQLRDHQGQQRRRELRLPALGHREGHRRRRSRPATSRSSARTTPTTGMRPSRRPPWSST